MSDQSELFDLEPPARRGANVNPLGARTAKGLCAMSAVSAMQKAIRRGDEVLAMEMAAQVGDLSRNCLVFVCNRLEIISHEDTGLANPLAILIVATSVEQAKRLYRPDDPGRWRMLVGTAIRILCRGAKSREGDHFHAAVCLRMDLTDYQPTIPDCAYDMHTVKGKKLGRGIEHFRTEAAKLDPPATPDQYEALAYEMWALQRGE